MNSLNQLHDALPGWVSDLKKKKQRLHILANAQTPSGVPGRSYNLIIELVGNNRIAISEDPINTKLPRCCMERHINEDASFCLHLDSSRPILNPETASLWWNSVGSYLNHQDYASKWRKWPIRAQLSHGGAADIQVHMEKLTEPLGWTDELLTSIFRGVGWLAGPLPRLSKDKLRLANVRSPCPRDCRAKHYPFQKYACTQDDCGDECRKQHRSILRIDCPQRSTVEYLVQLEYLRRRKEKKIIEYLRQKGIKCCGTMDNCPLSKDLSSRD